MAPSTPTVCRKSKVDDNPLPEQTKDRWRFVVRSVHERGLSLLGRQRIFGNINHGKTVEGD
eukprot:1761866-Amphidinium_carterae.1